MKKVAIILCTWQGERYLAEFLDSVLAQTYQNWKIYAADDCSTDQTPEIIERYRQQYPDKFVNLGRNKDNKGACRNFLEALANPSGDSADYYMQNNAWSEGGSDYCQGARAGDQVFFRNFAHTGLVYDWDDNYIYTIEGNVNGNRVETRRYSLSDTSIDGFGHPRYDGDEYPTSDGSSDTTPEPEPTPAPNPEPTPEPYTVWFKVHTNGGVLRLRSAPNTSSAYLIGIPNGTELESNAIVEGEEINGDTRWAHTTYKGYTGFVSCAWLD